MTQVQEQKLKKYIDFREYLSQNPLLVDRNFHLKPHCEAFLNYLNLILKTKEMMEENVKIISDYNQLKKELINVSLTISRKITAYSLLEELTDVQGMFCYTYEELDQESDDRVIKKCQNLLQFVLKFNEELLDYNIDNNLGLKLRSLIDQFQLIFETKRTHIETFTSNNEYITQLLKETDEIFDNNLCNLSEIVMKQ